MGNAKGLVYVGDDVLDVFEPDGETHEVVGDAALALLVGGELLMGGAGGVDHERLGVADVGEVGEELDGVDEPAAGVEVALDAEPDDGAEAAAEVFPGEFVGGVIGGARGS